MIRDGRRREEAGELEPDGTAILGKASLPQSAGIAIMKKSVDVRIPVRAIRLPIGLRAL